MKECRVCKKQKPLKDYPFDKRAVDGRQKWCRKCHSAWQRYFNKHGKKPFSIKREMPKGSESKKWKGGKTRNHSGYVMVWVAPMHQYQYEHRMVMEKFIGRSLTSDEFVHHKDGNKTNNSIENLEIISNSEHTSLHLKERYANRIIRFSECHPDRKHFAKRKCKKCYHRYYMRNWKNK